MTGWTLLAAVVGLMMLTEGLALFVNPARWRELMQQLLQMNDGQLRFIGMIACTLGATIFLLAVRFSGK